MVKNSARLHQFEKELVRKRRADFNKNLKIVDSLYEEACRLGIFPLKDSLEGIDIKIRLAKVINSVL